MNKYKLSSSLNTFELSKSDIENLDLTKLKEGNFYHLISEGKNYHIEALSTQNDKEIVLLVNGRRVEFSLQSELDQLIDQLGFSSNKEKSVKEILAPMPGLVLKVLVEEGQEVEEGDSLLVLEAMKMENIIKSPVRAVVSSIEVQIGEAVEKKRCLISFE